jgi:N4-gp56 family major capsid protein
MADVFDGRTAADFLSDPDTRVAYGEEINKEMMVKSKVAPFIAKNPNDEGAIIKGVVGTLEQGNNFRVPFVDELLDAGARGNVKFNATEEELKKLSMFVKVDMIQHSVPSTETVLNPTSAKKFRTTATVKLKNWGVRKFDNIVISAFTADCTNIVACGHHTSGATSSVTINDKFCLADVSEAKARAEQGYAYNAAGVKIEVPQLLPFMQEENAQAGYFETLNYYVMWIGSDAERDLKLDPNWTSAVKYAKERGLNNPLFTGSLGFWDGVLLLPFKTANKRQSGILRSDGEFTGFSNIKKYDLTKYAGAAGIPTEINLFLGAGAGAIAVDQPANFYDWADKDDPRFMKAGTDKIFGFAKTRYNSRDNDDLLEDNVYNNKDFGVIAVVSPCKQ